MNSNLVRLGALCGDVLKGLVIHCLLSNLKNAQGFSRTRGCVRGRVGWQGRVDWPKFYYVCRALHYFARGESLLISTEKELSKVRLIFDIIWNPERILKFKKLKPKKVEIWAWDFYRLQSWKSQLMNETFSSYSQELTNESLTVWNWKIFVNWRI